MHFEPHIKNVSVTGLWKRPQCELNFSDLSDKVILFGGNGKGKTTLLNILYHALAPKRNAGHKTWLANCPFNSIFISFGSGAELKITRARDVFVGPYWYSYRSARGEAMTVYFDVMSSDGSFDIADQLSEDKSHICKVYSDDAKPIYYLTDSRKYQFEINGTGRGSTGDEGDIVAVNSVVRRGITRTIIESENAEVGDVGSVINKVLKGSLRKANQHLSRSLRSAMHRGEEGANSIYRSIIGQLSNDTLETTEHAEFNDYLRDIQRDMQMFTKYEVIQPIDIQYYESKYAMSPSQQKSLIRKIILPHLRSYKQKADALRAAVLSVDSFCETVNSFFTDKTLSYSFSEGLALISADGERLGPECLSSGEKQLLIMLLTVLSHADSGAIFIIDEPEISLNLMWQRNLIRSIDRIAGVNSGSQLFMATHSMEIIGQYSDCLHQVGGGK